MNMLNLEANSGMTKSFEENESCRFPVVAGKYLVSE